MPKNDHRHKNPHQMYDQNVSHLCSSYPILNKNTGIITFESFGWTVEKRFHPFVDLYQLGHLLMPDLVTQITCPTHRRNEQQPAIMILRLARAGCSMDRDDILRALAILGHSPNKESLAALAQFARADHELAPVAHIAFCECTGLRDHLY